MMINLFQDAKLENVIWGPVYLAPMAMFLYHIILFWAVFHADP